MLKKIDESTVVSSEGYRIELDLHSLSYTEGEKIKTFDIEDEGEPHCLIIYVKDGKNRELKLN